MLKKNYCIVLQSHKVVSKEKVASLASFYLVSQQKILCHREVFVLKGYFHHGQSMFLGESLSRKCWLDEPNTMLLSNFAKSDTGLCGVRWDPVSSRQQNWLGKGHKYLWTLLHLLSDCTILDMFILKKYQNTGYFCEKLLDPGCFLLAGCKG